MFVYDLENASVIRETLETWQPTAAAPPVFHSASVLGGQPQAIGSPDASFDTDQLVTITTATDDADIYYTVDGSRPNPFANPATRRFEPNEPIVDARLDGQDITFTAIVLKSQMYPSEVISQRVRINYLQVATVSFAPTPNVEYTQDIAITLSTQTDGAQIWYTLTTNPITPLVTPTPLTGTRYDGPIPVAGLGVRHRIMAMASKSQMLDGEVSAEQWYQERIPPAGLTVGSPTPSSLDLSWLPVTGTGTITYELQRATASAGPYAPVPNATGLTVTSFTDDDGGVGLSGAAQYFYKVRASNGTLTTDLSPPASGTTSVGPPAAPVGLSATATQSTITLSWAAVAGADSYTVARAPTSGGTFATIGSVAAPVTSITDDNAGAQLDAGTAYDYQVTAHNAGGSTSSAVFAAVTVPPTPAAPTVAATSGTSLTVTWTSVQGATSYTVLRSVSSVGPYSAVPDGTVAGTSLLDDDGGGGLTSSTTYYYQVQASNAGGTSPASLFGSGRTLDLPDLVVAITITGYTTNTVSYNYVITNVGLAPAPLGGLDPNSNADNVTLQNYYSASPPFGDLPAGGSIIGTDAQLGILGPGQSHTGTYNASGNVNLATHPYLIVKLLRVVPESNSANNYASELISPPVP